MSKPLMNNKIRTLSIMRIFKTWELSNVEMLTLLGYSRKSTSTIQKLKTGEAKIALNTDIQDRAIYLLAIHECLGRLFPTDRSLETNWIRHKNGLLNSHSPLEIMHKKGMLGMIQVLGLVNLLTQS